MTRRSRSIRRAGERGQVVIMGAAMLIAVIAAAALAIDLGANASVRAQLQGVADAAAFAGARYLPELAASGTCSPVPSDIAAAAACNLVTANLAGSGQAASAQTTWSVSSAGTSIQIVVAASAPSLFAGVLGIKTTRISAVSTARNTPIATGPPALLFAGDAACSGIGITIRVNNSTATDNGAFMQSNGALNISLNQGTFGPTTYGGPNHCPASIASTNNNSATFNGSQTPTFDATSHAFPLTYSQASICAQPGATNGTNLTVTSGSTGIYCATGTITGGGATFASGAAGLTLIAAQINLSAGTITLTPFYQGLLLLQTGAASTLTLGGNVVSITGVIDVPSGTVSVTGANNTINGFVEAKDINIQGILSLTGTGPPTGGAQANSIDYTQ